MNARADLLSQRYGKGRVRVLRVVRGADGVHSVHEVTASVMLHGDFAASYLSDDNHQVVPTDTMKNTVHILAREHLGDVIENFALALGDHFLGRYDHVSQVEIELVETPWQRYTPADGTPHPHAFLGTGHGQRFTKLLVTRSEATISSGQRGVLILKSTASGFKGFPRCDYTTLKETDDRIFSTSMDATWTFTDRSVDFAAANKAIMPALLHTFATEFSPSVQNTLFLMGQAALAATSSITQIALAMPNKHYLPINFEPFGLGNKNEVFLPTDEPHGQIEAVITRATS